MRSVVRHLLLVPLGALLAAGCSGVTEPRPLTIDIAPKSFSSPAERDAWPTTPNVIGGAKIRVRGTVVLGCGGSFAGRAVRHGDLIDVQLNATTRGNVYCLAIVADSPYSYEATLGPLEPGTYRVHVSVTGQGTVDWTTQVYDVVTPF